MNMQLFSRFIPNIETTAQVENLQNMVEQVREMQAEIRENLELAEYVELLLFSLLFHFNLILIYF